MEKIGVALLVDVDGKRAIVQLVSVENPVRGVRNMVIKGESDPMNPDQLVKVGIFLVDAGCNLMGLESAESRQEVISTLAMEVGKETFVTPLNQEAQH